MGLLGHILGGALQGAGAGIVQDAATRRDAALAAMKIKYQQDKDASDAARETAKRQEDRDWKKEDQATDYKNRAGLLAIGGAVQSKRDEAQHGYKVEEIKQTQVGQRELATLQARLTASNTAAEINLRDKLESGDISEVVRGADGEYYGRTKNGLVPTGVKAPESAAQVGETGGGRLTEGEQAAAYEDDRKAWTKGGRQGAEPKKSDYIGLTRETYASRRGGGAKPAATATAPAAKPQPKPSNVVSMSDYQAGLNEAIRKRNSGVKGYAGLTDTQLRAKLEDIAKEAGYTLPKI